MRDERRIADECNQLLDDLDEERLVLEKISREAMDCDYLGRHVALRINVAMKALPGRDAIDELDAADLHDPMPLERVESRRLRIEHDFAHVYIPAVAATESLSPLRHCSNRVKDRTHLGARRFKATRSVHDKIRPTLLLVIRHLLREDRVEFVYGHAWPFERARPLHLGRRGYHHHGIDPVLAAGFEQERNVEYRDRLAARLGFSQQPTLRLLHDRMN